MYKYNNSTNQHNVQFISKATKSYCSFNKIYIKSILIPVVIGGIIGLIISNFLDYNLLEKPFLAPSGMLFPII